MEQLAIDRAKQLFGAEHANVQAHSGTQANISVYMTAVEPGATVLGMNLAHGGHLTHGHPLNFSGKMYKFVAYGVTKETERIDYDEVERLAREHRPKLVVCGASAYSRVIDFARLQVQKPELVHDMPANGRRFVQKVDGYETTIVAGTPIFEHGEHTGALPGKLIRAGREQLLDAAE